MNKYWKYYCYFMIILFAIAMVANMVNARFFYGHNDITILKLSLNFATFIILDISLIVLHFIFVLENKTPSRWWQIFLTVANVLVAFANITLLIR